MKQIVDPSNSVHQTVSMWKQWFAALPLCCPEFSGMRAFQSGSSGTSDRPLLDLSLKNRQAIAERVPIQRTTSA